ncbi:MAG TPA: MBL fold metallo-hydrolase [Rubrivivax sp.]|jgi:pyrroloquinoline quinone biosynthesis protein B|nr:MBL fold metallo-hydrolase [Rubrivivax sp.]
MKLVILRGAWGRGAVTAGRRDTAELGVAAIGVGDRWVLVNLSSQIAGLLDRGQPLPAAPGLCEGQRRAVVLTDGQLEHASGLLGLRKGGPIDLYATPSVFEEFTSGLPVLPALQHYCGVHWHVVPVAGDCSDSAFRVLGMPELEFTAVAISPPPWPHVAGQRVPTTGDSIALRIRDLVTGGVAFVAPGLAMPGVAELDWMRQSDCILIEDLPQDLPDHMAWVDAVTQFPSQRKIVLSHTAARRAQALAKHGVEVARDGMEIDL